jgi:tetratricopeptide (TPR) repeat protein
MSVPTIEKQQQAMDQLDLAKVSYDAKDYNQALGHIRRAVGLDPNNVNARVLQARVYLRQNRPNLAMSALNAHDQAAPDMADVPEVSMLRAEALAGSGFDRIARGQLQTLAAQLPDDVRPYRMLSGLYLKLNQFNEAIGSLRDVVRLSPSDQASTRLLSDLLAKRDPQAGIDLLLAGQADTQEPGVLLRAARQCQKLDRLRDADELYESLLKIRPNDVGVLLECGRLADEMGEDVTAVRRLEKAVSIPGDHITETLIALSITHTHAGRFQLAAMSCWKAARLSPHDAAAWAGLVVNAQACGRAGLADRASAVLNRYTGSRQRQKQLATFWQHAAAPMAIDIGLDNAPPDHAGQSVFQTLLKQATHTLADVTQDYPQRADAHYHLAVCYHFLDDPTEANIHNDQALAINPGYEAAKRLADQIEEHLEFAA